MVMDARLQEEAGRRLDVALRAAGLNIEHAVLARGNLTRWTPVDGSEIVGRLQALTGWRVRIADGEANKPRTRTVT